MRLPPLDKLYSEVALFEERFYGITAAECNALLPHITSALLITEDDLSGKYADCGKMLGFYNPCSLVFANRIVGASKSF